MKAFYNSSHHSQGAVLFCPEGGELDPWKFDTLLTMQHGEGKFPAQIN